MQLQKLPFAIGDLQGCNAEFSQLLDAIEFESNGRALWCAGDLINRGPESLETLRFLRKNDDRIHCILGNHDLHLLAMAAGVRVPGKRDTARQILQAPDAAELIEWLRRRPLAIELQSFVMVHAGLYPWWTTEQLMELTQQVGAALASDHWRDHLATMYGNTPNQWSTTLNDIDRLRFVINACTRMRFVSASGELDFETKEGAGASPTGFFPWFEHPAITQQKMTVVFGHWSTQGLLNQPTYIGLDTGCVWGGKLSAIDLATRAITQVDCASHQAPG